ncbi:MAG: leucine-rich repeat protein, partial [Treponemataceae bacterium]
IKTIGISAFENNTSLADVYIDSTEITNRTDNDAHLLSAAQTVYVEKSIMVSNESYIAKNFPSKLPASGNYIRYGRVTGIEVTEFYEVKVGESVEVTIATLPAGGEEGVSFEIVGDKIIEVERTSSNKFTVKCYNSGNTEILFSIGSVTKSTKIRVTGLLYSDHSGASELIVTGIGTLTNEANLIMPDEVHGIPVTKIANEAFKGNQTLKSVHIGKNIKAIGLSAFETNTNLADVYIDSTEIATLADNEAHLLSAAQTVYVEKNITVSNESYIAKNFPSKLPASGNYIRYGRVTDIEVNDFYEVNVGESVEVTIATVPAGGEEGVSFEIVGEKIIEVERTSSNKFTVKCYNSGSSEIRFSIGIIEKSIEVRVTGLLYSDHSGASELSVIGIGTLTNEANLTMPDEVYGIPVTAIANEAFKGNQTLTSVHIGKNIKSIGISAFENNSNLIDVYIDSTEIANYTDNDAHLLSAAQTVYVEKNITVSNESYIVKNFPSKMPASGDYIRYGRVTGIDVNEFYEVNVGESVEVTIATVPAGGEEGVSFEIVGDKIIEVERTASNKFLVNCYNSGNTEILFSIGSVTKSTKIRAKGLLYSDHSGASELS